MTQGGKTLAAPLIGGNEQDFTRRGHDLGFLRLRSDSILNWLRVCRQAAPISRCAAKVSSQIHEIVIGFMLKHVRRFWRSIIDDHNWALTLTKDRRSITVPCCQVNLL